MTGVKVTVCDDSGSNCNFCREVDWAVDPNAWISVSCNPGAKGTILRLEHETEPLTLCEIEAYGYS